MNHLNTEVTQTCPTSKLQRVVIAYTAGVLIFIFGIFFTLKTLQRPAPLAPAAVVLSEEERDVVCRAWMAYLFNQSIAAVSVYKHEGQVVYLEYKRASDSTVWMNRCRIEGNRIIWGDVTGRWRIDPRDEVGTFTLNRLAKTVAIQESSSGEQLPAQVFTF